MSYIDKINRLIDDGRMKLKLKKKGEYICFYSDLKGGFMGAHLAADGGGSVSVGRSTRIDKKQIEEELQNFKRMYEAEGWVVHYGKVRESVIYL